MTDQEKQTIKLFEAFKSHCIIKGSIPVFVLLVEPGGGISFLNNPAFDFDQVRAALRATVETMTPEKIEIIHFIS